MSRATVFVLGLVALGAILGTWSQLAESVESVEPTADLMVNRAWVNRMPKSKKDVVSWFIPLEVKKKRFGVAQKNSHYWFAGERFTYNRQGNALRLTFQQSDRRVDVTARAYDCKGKAPSGFDYCLDLSRKGDKVTLYSKKAWKVPRDAGLTEIPDVDLTPIDEEPCGDCVEGVPLALSGLW